jgi:hypothetical protein
MDQIMGMMEESGHEREREARISSLDMIKACENDNTLSPEVIAFYRLVDIPFPFFFIKDG